MVCLVLSVGLFDSPNLGVSCGFLYLFVLKDGDQSFLTTTLVPTIIEEEQQQKKKKISVLLDLSYDMYLSFFICVIQVEL